MKRKIMSTFTVEKGIWNEQENKYVDRSFETRNKEIEMIIEEKNGKDILRFIGGPTGYESYYIDDLIAGGLCDNIHLNFCICGGTINSWPRCEVPTIEVVKFLSDSINIPNSLKENATPTIDQK